MSLESSDGKIDDVIELHEDLDVNIAGSSRNSRKRTSTILNNESSPAKIDKLCTSGNLNREISEETLNQPAATNSQNTKDEEWLDFDPNPIEERRNDKIVTGEIREESMDLNEPQEIESRDPEIIVVMVEKLMKQFPGRLQPDRLFFRLESEANSLNQAYRTIRRQISEGAELNPSLGEEPDLWNQGQTNERTDPKSDAINKILQIFPNVSKIWLHGLISAEGVDVNHFINTNMMKEFPKQVENLTISTSAQSDRNNRRQQFIDPTRFNPEEFVRIFEDPENYFMDEERAVSENYRAHAHVSLLNTFPNVRRAFVEEILRKHKYHYLPSVREIQGQIDRENAPRDGGPVKKKSPGPSIYDCNRRNEEQWPLAVDEQFFREYQFANRHQEINELLQDRRIERMRKFQLAQNLGETLECKVCSEEMLQSENFACPQKHFFCKNCVKQHATFTVTDGGHKIECMQPKCNEVYSIDVLRQLLIPHTLDLILRRSQQQEIRDAQVEGIESCPFCDFMLVIENPQERLFRCLNPDCTRISCRECRREGHIPYRCDEVNNSSDLDTQMRTHVENAMAEALIRRCPTCNNQILKETGCNKLKCPCGAYMCYVCRQLLANSTGYTHYRGQGSLSSHGCPLYSTSDQVHADPSAQAGENARAQFLLMHPQLRGVTDAPEVEELVDRRPNERGIAGMNDAMIEGLNAWNPGMGIGIIIDDELQARRRRLPPRLIQHPDYNNVFGRAAGRGAAMDIHAPDDNPVMAMGRGRAHAPDDNPHFGRAAGRGIRGIHAPDDYPAMGRGMGRGILPDPDDNRRRYMIGHHRALPREGPFRAVDGFEAHRRLYGRNVRNTVGNAFGYGAVDPDYGLWPEEERPMDLPAPIQPHLENLDRAFRRFRRDVDEFNIAEEHNLPAQLDPAQPGDIEPKHKQKTAKREKATAEDIIRNINEDHHNRVREREQREIDVRQRQIEYRRQAIEDHESRRLQMARETLIRGEIDEPRVVIERMNVEEQIGRMNGEREARLRKNMFKQMQATRKEYKKRRDMQANIASISDPIQSMQNLPEPADIARPGFSGVTPKEMHAPVLDSSIVESLVAHETEDLDLIEFPSVENVGTESTKTIVDQPIRIQSPVKISSSPTTSLKRLQIARSKDKKRKSSLSPFRTNRMSLNEMKSVSFANGPPEVVPEDLPGETIIPESSTKDYINDQQLPQTLEQIQGLIREEQGFLARAGNTMQRREHHNKLRKLVHHRQNLLGNRDNPNPNLNPNPNPNPRQSNGIHRMIRVVRDSYNRLAETLAIYPNAREYTRDLVRVIGGMLEDLRRSTRPPMEIIIAYNRQIDAAIQTLNKNINLDKSIVQHFIKICLFVRVSEEWYALFAVHMERLWVHICKVIVNKEKGKLGKETRAVKDENNTNSNTNTINHQPSQNLTTQTTELNEEAQLTKAIKEANRLRISLAEIRGNIQMRRVNRLRFDTQRLEIERNIAQLDRTLAIERNEESEITRRLCDAVGKRNEIEMRRNNIALPKSPEAKKRILETPESPESPEGLEDELKNLMLKKGSNPTQIMGALKKIQQQTQTNYENIPAQQRNQTSNSISSGIMEELTNKVTADMNRFLEECRAENPVPEILEESQVQINESNFDQSDSASNCGNVKSEKLCKVTATVAPVKREIRRLQKILLIPASQAPQNQFSSPNLSPSPRRSLLPSTSNANLAGVIESNLPSRSGDSVTPNLNISISFGGANPVPPSNINAPSFTPVVSSNSSPILKQDNESDTMDFEESN